MHTKNPPQTTSKSQERDAAIQITLNSELITAETIDGITYYSTTRRGVAYTTYQTKGGDWWVSSRRLALGRSNAGGGRYYTDLAALCDGCKAFAGLSVFISMTR